MSLGTLDRSPPPFFRQGPSALAQLIVLGALAVFLMVADARFTLVAPVRAAIATALLPVQRALLSPLTWFADGRDYLAGLDHALKAEREARRALAEQALLGARVSTLESENRDLRELIGLREGLATPTLAAEVLHASRDVHSRRLVINRGAQSGVVLGAPVVVPEGVLGLVVRVYPLSAEVAMLADRDAAIAVLLARSRVRGIAVGGARHDQGGAMEWRFVSANADVEVGDLLQTSGLDGWFPPGLPVATVVHIERRVESGFARVMLRPVVDGAERRQVLVIKPAPTPPASVPAAAAAAAAASSAVTAAPAGAARRARGGP